MAHAARSFPGGRRRADPASGRDPIAGPPSAMPEPAPAGQWAIGINLLLGLWLIVAPWILGDGGEGNVVWNEVVVGAAIALIAVVRVNAPARWAPLGWINVVLGGWLVVAPFVLTSNTALISWNDVIIGVAVVIMALISTIGSARDMAARA
jgi:hypothetical protein